MPKLRVLSAKELCRILQNNGFQRIRQKGSHIVLQQTVPGSDGKTQTITVIVPDHDEIAVGTLSSIIRQSGLPRSMFE